MTKLSYIPVELHSHTYHSDASFSERDLLEAAKGFGYKALFVTDHNTNAPLDYIYENKLDTEIIPTYPGSEWTTFFGHMVILGNREMGDYTKARIDNLDHCIAEIKNREANIALGIAHPYAIGNPICTGCHWDFDVDDYSNFDYIELSNGENTEEDFANELAYRKWDSLLADGYKLAALAGRDWHGSASNDVVVAINMLGIEADLSEEAALAAIKSQRTYVTYGPIMDLDLGEIVLGDTISEGDIISGFICISEGTFANSAHIGIRPEELRIFNNKEIIFESAISYDKKVDFSFIPKKGYLRFEILGTLKAIDDFKLIISSPIYVN